MSAVSTKALLYPLRPLAESELGSVEVACDSNRKSTGHKVHNIGDRTKSQCRRSFGLMERSGSGCACNMWRLDRTIHIYLC